MKLNEKSKLKVARAAASLVCSLAAFCYTVPAAHALTASWSQSDLDMWFYTNSEDPGQRTLAPTFANQLTVNAQTQQFDPLTVDNPARLGSALFAFDTTSFVEPHLAPGRYQINSVTFKATMSYDGSTKKIQYSNQPISQSDLLSQYSTGGSITGQRPMELYGVGFRAGYNGYGFASSSSGTQPIDEFTGPYSASGHGYVAYPMVRSETSPGTFTNIDVMNSVTGGYSATASSQQTAPFTADPWSIGTANLTSGADIPEGTTFTFSLDLTKPGVRAYVQESLAAGGLGLFLDTLHNTGVMGAGGGYPRWLTKEVPSGLAAKRPQLSIDYSILPAGIPGDYNGDGTVDAADYVLWRKGGPLLNQVDDPDHVTAQDYVEWKARFGNTAGSGSGLSANSAVPEPSAMALLMIIVPLLAARRHGRK